MVWQKQKKVTGLFLCSNQSRLDKKKNLIMDMLYICATFLVKEK